MPATGEDKPVMTTQSTVATVDVRIILAGLWTALMLIYLLGDVFDTWWGWRRAVYVEAVPVRVDSLGHVTEIGLLLRQAADGTISRLIVSGRVLFGERVRGRWMAGSNNFRRTQSDQSGNAGPASRIELRVLLIFLMRGWRRWTTFFSCAAECSRRKYAPDN